MTDPVDKDAAFKRVCELMNEARAHHHPQPAQAMPLHEHGAFDDMDASRWQIERARDALAGIAAIMMPQSPAMDEQLNMAHRRDVFAIFDYFAESMREPLEVLDSAAHRLKSDLRAAQP